MTSGVSSRVLKNTMALYVRMIFLTIISIFTYRVVFRALGASDYGTYNVVGGFVSMFAFVSGTMTIATQRYFAIGLASNDWKNVNKSFSVNVVIYALLSIIILVLAETVGLWFVTTKLNVNYSRMTDIIVVYETSIATFLIGMMVSPFLALLVADENITIYSWISIIEGFFKILIAYVLYVFNGDKLAIYAFLLLAVSVIVNSIYIIYCYKKYKNLRFTYCKDKREYKSVFSFIGWNMIGAVAAVGKNQGINIIINIFFGTIINAARAVAYQLNVVISSFAQNFMKAIDPRIIKAYANGAKEEFIGVIHLSSKISYYLLLVIVVPFISNVEYVLRLWLGDIPDYTTIFTALVLVDALILSVTDPILTGVQAIGKMKGYQLTVGIISLLNLPVAFIALKITRNPLVPFVVAIVLDIAITAGRLINFKRLYDFSILQYSKKIFLPAIIVTICATVLNGLFLSNAQSFIHLVGNVIACEIIMAALIMLIGLTSQERSTVMGMIPIFRRK